MRILKIIKNLKNLGRLKVEDEKWLAENKLALFEFVKNNHVREVASNHFSVPEKFHQNFISQIVSGQTRLNIFKLILKPIPIIAGIIIVALLAGGGTTLASQSSLPGDTLYPVKLVTENVQTAMAFNPEKKVELEAKFANRRLEEIQKLQERLKNKEGEIPSEVVEKAMNQAEQRLEKAEGRISEMEKGDLKGKTLDAASYLEEALETHQQILSDLAGKLPEPAGQTLLHAQEVAAKYSTKALERILTLEKTDEAGDQIIEKVKEGGTPKILGAEERAEGKLKSLENGLQELENYIENLKEQGKEMDEYQIKLDETKSKIEEAKKLLQEKKYLEAFDAAGAAMRLLIETKLLLRPVLMPYPLPVEGPTPTPPAIKSAPSPTESTVLPTPEPVKMTEPIDLGPFAMPLVNVELMPIPPPPVNAE
jgi:hypothetical protein